MPDTEIRLLQPTYLPPGQAPLPAGEIVRVDSATAAEMIAAGAAEAVAPADPA